MKAKTKPTKKSGWILSLFVLVLAGMYTSPADAQYRRPNYMGSNSYSGPAFYMGVEATSGIRAFKLNSNFDQFNNINVIGQGQSVGFVAGGNTVMLKVRHGAYKSSHRTAKEIDMKETTVAINVLPLRFGEGRSRNIEPYATIDIDANKINLHGNPLPKKVAPKVQPKPDCCCEPEGNLPPPPNPAPAPAEDKLAQTETSPETNGIVYVGSVKTVRASIGVGLMANIGGKRTFAKLFTEAKYGGSLSMTSNIVDLQKTTVSGQFSLNFGVMMGLNVIQLGKR